MKYHVEIFPIGACVCNENGYNCLVFPDKPGAKFTTVEHANRLCKQMNGETDASDNQQCDQGA